MASALTPFLALQTSLSLAASQQHQAARHSYLAIYRIHRRLLSVSTRRHNSVGNFNRPFTGVYEPGQPTLGPLGEASKHGVSKLSPKKLKEYLDKFVVGQERSKKMMAVAIYNHYQRTQVMMTQEEEERERVAKLIRQNYDRIKRHPSEDEFPGQIPTVDMQEGKAVDIKDPKSYDSKRIGAGLATDDHSPTIIEKSNIMMLGPTGVGKTHIAKTLARVLSVPFSMSDCTPFTQSGYIGEDAEVCVHRLLAAADYDVAAAEHGIIYLDEVDKLAAARVSHGKDVSGEGVQQALLKIIEGTTLTITAKSDKKSNPSNNYSGGFGGGAAGAGALGAGGQKQETYQVRTDNMLFIFSGAFVGLDKIILNRVSKSSMGFGAAVRSKASFSTQEASANEKNPHNLDPTLFSNLLPFYKPTSHTSSAGSSSSSTTATGLSEDTPIYNILDLTTPSDLQTYGLIPEFTGRIPTLTALSPLSLTHLTRILTEPRSSLTAQYKLLFSTYGAELRFTTPALHSIAREAQKMATGARALRTVIERILVGAMYEVPGSSVRYVLVGKDTVSTGGAEVGYWGRGQGSRFLEAAEKEEVAWREELEARDTGKARGEVESFAVYRASQVAAGGGGA